MARRIRRDALRFLFLAGLVAAFGLSSPFAARSADTYTFDKGHTKIYFFYDHMGLSTQSGRFNEFDGTFVLDEENPANSTIEIVINAASVDTGVPDLDADIRSENVFDAANFPTITFKSTEVRQTGTKTVRITGNLTIKGNTRPIALDATLVYTGDHPLAEYYEEYANVRYVTFSVRGQILRSDFDVGLYAPGVSDELDLVIEAELRNRK